MIKSIPLNKLVASPRNVRKHTNPVADAELKASIEANGLLQNLIVRVGKKGKYEVEAGERRRKALVALAAEKLVPIAMLVTCLVIEGDEAQVLEVSLAENFHNLAMNPADEAQAFASIIEAGSSAEEVARRFGLTVRFVEGRLRLAALAPIVFEALAAGEITLEIAKAYGATSDQAIQARVFEQASQSWYSENSDTIRRMVLTTTVCGSDPRAKLVGKDAYLAAGGTIDRELFDDEESESWADIGLLEQLAQARMSEVAVQMAEEQGVAWVKPTLDHYVTHDITEGLHRVPVAAPEFSEEEIARLGELDAEYDAQAAVLEDELAGEDDIRGAEAALERIEAESEAIKAKPPVIDPEVKKGAGLILTLGRDGTPTLQPNFYAEYEPVTDPESGPVEIVTTGEGAKTGRAAMSQRLVDELAMQRRDVLALHVASDPALALDLFVFNLADGDAFRFGSDLGMTIKGPVATGPAYGFEAKDAPATVALADMRSNLDESWRAGETVQQRFDLYRALGADARADWLGWVVGRTLEASLNVNGTRANRFHDHLGSMLGIDMASWWRPTAINFFDRVSKLTILEALTEVGGPTLASRFTASKKGELATSAERIFAGNFITEEEVKAQAMAWIPTAMTFADIIVADAEPPAVDDEAGEAPDAEPDVADMAA